MKYKKDVYTFFFGNCETSDIEFIVKLSNDNNVNLLNKLLNINMDIYLISCKILI